MELRAQPQPEEQLTFGHMSEFMKNTPFLYNTEVYMQTVTTDTPEYRKFSGEYNAVCLRTGTMVYFDGSEDITVFPDAVLDLGRAITYKEER